MTGEGIGRALLSGIRAAEAIVERVPGVEEQATPIPRPSAASWWQITGCLSCW